jgi:hypothetical protein
MAFERPPPMTRKSMARAATGPIRSSLGPNSELVEVL